MKKTIFLLLSLTLFTIGCASTRSELRVNWEPFSEDLEIQFVAIGAN